MKIEIRNFSTPLFLITIFFIPTQFGYHFWPDFSIVDGIRVDYLSPTLYVTDVLLLSQFVLHGKCFLEWIKKKKKNIQLTRLFFALVVVISIGILLSVNPGAGVYGLVRLVEMVLFGALVKHVASKEVLRASLVVLSLGLISQSLLAVVQFFHQSAIGGLFYFFGERMIVGSTPGAANVSLGGALILRPYGTFSHPNVLGGFLVIGVMLQNLIPLKKLNILSMCLGIVGLFASLSRSALVVVVGALGWVILYKKLKVNKVTIIGVVTLLVGIGAFFPFVTERFVQTSFDESVSMRFSLIQNAVSMTMSHPFFGVGLNNFYNHVHSSHQPVHNVMLLILSQTGVFGFALSGYLLMKTFFQTKNKVLRTTLIAVLVLSMTDHYFLTSQQGLLIVSFVLGLAWSPLLRKESI